MLFFPLFFQLWVMSAGGRSSERVSVHLFYASGAKTDTVHVVFRLMRGLKDVWRRVGRARGALVLGRRGQRSVSALGAKLVLQVVVTVLTDPHWRRDLQSLDL